MKSIDLDVVEVLSLHCFVCSVQGHSTLNQIACASGAPRPGHNEGVGFDQSPGPGSLHKAGRGARVGHCSADGQGTGDSWFHRGSEILWADLGASH